MKKLSEVRNEKFRVITVFSFLGLVLLSVFLIMINPSTAKSEDKEEPLRTSTPTIAMSEIDELRIALESEQLDPKLRLSLEMKLKYAQKEATRQAGIASEEENLFSKKLTELAINTLPPTNEPNRRPVGLIDDLPSWSLTRDAIINNIWVQEVDGAYYQVGAGHILNDPDQGVVYFLIERPHQLFQYLAPEKTGELIISGFMDGLVSISSRSGKIYYFDIQARKLLDENQVEVIVSTPTPPAPYP
jgi:hypothetical protein